MKEFCYLTVALLISSTMANAQLRAFYVGLQGLFREALWSGLEQTIFAPRA